MTSAEENLDASVHAIYPSLNEQFNRLMACAVADVGAASVSLQKREDGAMSALFAMQRANGDWFALDDHGAFRVPVFRSNSDAMQARAFNIEMLVFRPVVLDETSLKDLARVNPTGPSHFWLVDQATVNLKRGHRVEHAELSRFAREPGGNNGNG